MILTFHGQKVYQQEIMRLQDIDVFSKYNHIRSNLRHDRFFNVALFYIVVSKKKVLPNSYDIS